MALTLDGDNGVSGVNGSAGTPAIQGTDTNTGISFGTDTVNLVTGGSTRATVDSSGRLLVGTTTSVSSVSPSIQTARSGAGFFAIGNSATFTGSGTLGQIGFYANQTGGYGFGGSITAEGDGTWSSNTDCPSRLVFATTADSASSPTERMRITEKGSLLVSSTGAYLSSTASYHYLAHNTASDNVVYLRHLASSGTAHGVVVQLENGANDTTSYHLRNYVGGTLRSAFYSNGGLANVSANNANLSDRNAKKDIAPAAGTWDCLKEWEIVNYRYKDQPDDADLNLGVIAQQVAESCPEVITVFEEAKQAKAAVLDDDGNEVEPAQEAQPEKLGVKEQQMMWMAIKALQEAQTRIEQLETRVAQLEGGAS